MEQSPVIESTPLPPVLEKKRFHDLDALRAFAMLLGIVLHGALSFFPVPIWPAQDLQQPEIKVPAALAAPLESATSAGAADLVDALAVEPDVEGAGPFDLGVSNQHCARNSASISAVSAPRGRAWASALRARGARTS